ncbi:MAG: fumarylacetoacetate hydrolase family protein [Verrucomicrobiae bacterium]|nr:fumarylacetoacetate hydrolase family protein [Verrucomicrobiae bacterium]
MVELGRFKHGERVFDGERQADVVVERSGGVTTDRGGASGQRWDYGDLVVLCPAEPNQIVEVTLTSAGPKFCHRPPSSLGPHRAMVSVPRGNQIVTALPRISYVISKPLERIDPNEAMGALMGCVTAITFYEGGTADPESSAAMAHEGYTTLGAAITVWEGGTMTLPTLWHNGRAITASEPLGWAVPAAEYIAEVSAWTPLGPGDLVLIGGEEGAARIRPGDHMECRCAPLRPAAVNIGLRGSA